MVGKVLQFLLFLLGAQISTSKILLKENFSSFESFWDIDINGANGHVSKKSDQDNVHYISTNTTNCPDGSSPCYRSELKITQSKRSIFFPSSSTELWLGFSARIPKDWVWLGGNDDITAYIMQIHGGDNLGQGPIFGIRNKGTKMDVSICGNVLYSSPTSTCGFYPIGNVNIGLWENWVVHSVFSHTVKKGSVQVWRDGELVLNETNLLNSYNDADPHYLKIGTYVLQWKTLPNSYPTSLIQWVGVDYQHMIIGDANATFEDVYSWAGTPLPTAAPSSQPARSSSHKIYGVSKVGAILVVVGAGVVIILCCIALVACGYGSSATDDKIPSARAKSQGHVEMGNYAPAAASEVAIVVETNDVQL